LLPTTLAEPLDIQLGSGFQVTRIFHAKSRYFVTFLMTAKTYKHVDMDSRHGHGHGTWTWNIDMNLDMDTNTYTRTDMDTERPMIKCI
jgi:hypothetical protein